MKAELGAPPMEGRAVGTGLFVAEGPGVPGGYM